MKTRTLNSVEISFLLHPKNQQGRPATRVFGSHGTRSGTQVCFRTPGFFLERHLWMEMKSGFGRRSVVGQARIRIPGLQPVHKRFFRYYRPESELQGKS